MGRRWSLRLGGLAGLAAGELLARRRTARAVRDTTARLERELAPPPREVRTQTVMVEALAARPEPVRREPGTPLTDLLHGRLLPGDRDAIVALMADSSAELHSAADEPTRRRLELNHAAAFGPDAVRERLGLRAAMPPDEVHSMARDWTATGGDTFFGDLVLTAFAAAGAPLPPGGSVLDFGCSSGRVLRVLAAARPDLRCLGCDPNEGAIAWAEAHLPGTWWVSDSQPPLPLEDASLDGAFAISIWSHFAEGPATAWLEEMARVLRPGAGLVLTTHGWDALAAGGRQGTITPPTIGAAAEGLMAHGHHFVDVFGADGDWGVRDPGWGDAFLTAEWLAARVAGTFAVAELWPAALEGSQDLFVLRRR